jgi:hypothetical protein
MPALGFWCIEIVLDVPAEVHVVLVIENVAPDVRPRAVAADEADANVIGAPCDFAELKADADILPGLECLSHDIAFLRGAAADE